MAVSERIDFDQAIIATGAVQVSLRGFEPDGQKVVTAYDVLNWMSVPKTLLVLGGGVSGCELGEFAAAAGAHVTIVELMPQLLPGMDADLARELTQSTRSPRHQDLHGGEGRGARRSGDGVGLTVEKEGAR